MGKRVFKVRGKVFTDETKALKDAAFLSKSFGICWVTVPGTHVPRALYINGLLFEPEYVPGEPPYHRLIERTPEPLRFSVIAGEDGREVLRCKKEETAIRAVLEFSKGKGPQYRVEKKNHEK